MRKYIDDKMVNYTNKPNIINSIENNFKQLSINFPDRLEEIQQIRTDTYTQIIDTLCTEYHLQFLYRDDIDYYTSAQYMWDFLVCNFRAYMVNFFTRFIMKEKDSIYNALNLDKYKKAKDTNTIYGKDSFEDVRIAIISSNLKEILEYIKGFDISLYDIISFSYDKTRSEFISSILVDADGSFYTNIYYSILEYNIADIITDIKFMIQSEYSIIPQDLYTNIFMEA
jgi:hypothetical protein